MAQSILWFGCDNQSEAKRVSDTFCINTKITDALPRRVNQVQDILRLDEYQQTFYEGCHSSQPGEGDAAARLWWWQRQTGEG